MTRTPAHLSVNEGLEALEPRLVLSLTYYETLAIEELPGFPGGEAGSLAGASENGRFLWSHGATAEPYDEGDPAFLVIDRAYQPIEQFPSLGDASIADINSLGAVLAADRVTGRAFLADIAAAGERAYLDTLIIEAPPEFDLASAEPVEIGDGGIVVLTETAGNGSTRVWGLLDGVVRLLWASPYSSLHIDTTPDNAVTGSRYTIYDPVHWENTRTEGVRWSPARGLEPLGGLRYAMGVNARGDILGEIPDADKLNNRQTVIWSEGVIEPVDDTFTDWSVGLDDDLNVLLSRHEAFHGGAWDFPYIFSDGEVVQLSELGGNGGTPVAITDSGLLVFQDSICFAVSPDLLVGASESTTLLTTDASGRVIVVFKNRRGMIGTISSGDGALHYGEWALQGDTHRFERSAEAFTSRRDGSARFLLLNSPTVYSTTRHRLERESVLRPLRGADTTAFQSASGLERFAILDLEGELLLWFQRHGVDWQGNPALLWTQSNLSEHHLARRGLTTPAFTSDLDSFATPWGAMNIVGLDAAGELHTVWWSPGLRSPYWTTSNLTAASGAPRLVGNISASATPWNGMQIFGTDARGHAIAIWWSPGSGGWRWDDLTAETGGAPLAPGSLASVATPWGAIELVGRTESNEVATYWWAPGSAGWTYESITAEQAGAIPPITGPLSFTLGRDGSQHIAGVSAEGEVLHLYWLPDGSDLWRGENLTQLAMG